MGHTEHDVSTTGDAGAVEPPDDKALVARCLRDDQAAWALLIDRYERLVYSVPRRLGLDRDASEEVFQDVFTALVRQLPRLRNETGLPKWLMTTAWRTAVQSIRRRRQERTADPALPEGDPAPVERLIDLEERHRIDEALSHLGPRCRDLLLALYGDGRAANYEQIATRLEMPIGSIGPTRARCLKRLLELYDDGGAN